MDDSDVAYPRRNLTRAEQVLLFPDRPKAWFDDGARVCGVGLCVSHQYPFTVTMVTPDTPADRCKNLFPGDIIHAIDGRNLEGLTDVQVRELAVGRNGSRMILQIEPSPDTSGADRGLHPASKTLTIELTREPSYLPHWAERDEIDDRVMTEEEKWKYVAQKTAEYAADGINMTDIGKWEVRTDSKTKRVYYVDTFNNRSQWHKPDCMAWIDRFDEVPHSQFAAERYDEAMRMLEMQKRLNLSHAVDIEEEDLEGFRSRSNSDLELDENGTSDGLEERDDDTAALVPREFGQEGSDAKGPLAADFDFESDPRLVKMRDDFKRQCLDSGIDLDAIPSDEVEALYGFSELEGDPNDVELPQSFKDAMTGARESHLRF